MQENTQNSVADTACALREVAEFDLGKGSVGHSLLPMFKNSHSGVQPCSILYSSRRSDGMISLTRRLCSSYDAIAFSFSLLGSGVPTGTCRIFSFLFTMAVIHLGY